MKQKLYMRLKDGFELEHPSATVQLDTDRLTLFVDDGYVYTVFRDFIAFYSTGPVE